MLISAGDIIKANEIGENERGRSLRKMSYLERMLYKEQRINGGCVV